MTDMYRFWGKAKPSDGYRPLNLVAPRTDAADGSTDATTATIRMYGPIDSWGGMWGVSAEEVSAALDSLPDTVTNIQLRINSPGGEGFEGLAILNMLRAHPAKVTAVVDGLAASAASFIACGCDETIMSPGTQMMIHDASGIAYGNADTMAKAKAFLDSVSNSIAELYTEAAGGTRAKWRALMVAETWYTAQEAVSAGLAERVEVVADLGTSVTAGAEVDDAQADDDEPVMANSYDLSQFRYAGRDEAPDPLKAAAKAEESAPEDVETPDAPSADTPADDAAEDISAADSAEVSAEDDRVDNEKAVAALRDYRDAVAKFGA